MNQNTERNLKAKDANVLIIGGGGREHALGLRLKQDGVEKLYFAPGNAGTSEIGTNIGLPKFGFDVLYNWVLINKIDLIVVGPEVPLANGIVNFFNDRNIPIIGPTMQAAEIESSKIFARTLMRSACIPQPSFVACTDEAETREALKKYGLPVVIKVDGLAAGKGAFVCNNFNEVQAAVKSIFVDYKFGQTDVLVEECISGTEMSVFALCDMSGYKIIGTAKDYKRLLDNDRGPNTGGMGSISPSPLESPALMLKIKKRIIEKILFEMKRIGKTYTGVLYCGLMIRNNNPYVIEFNCRLGDPETQVILPRIKGNFFNLLKKAANNDLEHSKISFLDQPAVFIVKVAKGYPESYAKGDVIKNTLTHKSLSGSIIHSGTALNDKGELVTNGGRVIGAVCLADSMHKAIRDAYLSVYHLYFDGQQYREDIGF